MQREGNSSLIRSTDDMKVTEENIEITDPEKKKQHPESGRLQLELGKVLGCSAVGESGRDSPGKKRGFRPREELGTWDFGGVEEELETGKGGGEVFLQGLGRSGT